MPCRDLTPTALPGPALTLMLLAQAVRGCAVLFLDALWAAEASSTQQVIPTPLSALRTGAQLMPP